MNVFINRTTILRISLCRGKGFLRDFSSSRRVTSADSCGSATDVKMRRIVLIEIHADDDTQKAAVQERG